MTSHNNTSSDNTGARTHSAHHIIYIVIVGALFVALTVVFTMLPRSTFSQLERRELSSFPAFSADSLRSGAFSRDISSWFSDTEPYRDEFMTLNLHLTDAMKAPSSWFASGEEISYHAAEPEPEPEPEANANEGNISEFHNAKIAAEENATIGKSGTLVIGKAPNARALMVFGGTDKMGGDYAAVANLYKEKFPDVNVYCMAIPNAMEFYCPDKARKITKPQIATINNLYRSLNPDVKAVDCYTPLGQHVDEDIYLRTDHHWAPLGAYYAAQAFAKAAGVPFKDISTYERHVVHGFVGTMYGYSKDVAVKNSPEDFVYWTPTGVDYTTTYINYSLNKDLKVTGRGKPVQGEFFVKFNDGSSGAYCTFMGGDSKITKVETSTKNGRHLIILKDSFGNAIPGWLFHSFEEVHVIDCRYFIENMTQYVRDNKITDILFANSIFMCCGSKTSSNYKKYLTQ